MWYLYNKKFINSSITLRYQGHGKNQNKIFQSHFWKQSEKFILITSTAFPQKYKNWCFPYRQSVEASL